MPAMQIQNRFSTLLGRFGAEEKGIAAVEGAVVLALLSSTFVFMADLSVEAYTQNKLSNALRSSVQYIANEGRDLDRLEEMFTNSYGEGKSKLDQKLLCSCAKPRTDFSTGDTATGEPPQKAKPEVVEVSTVQDGSGRWGRCEMSCGTGPVIKYLQLTGTGTIRNIVKNEEVSVDVSYTVRVE